MNRILRHPEDGHLIFFHLLVVGTYLLAWHAWVQMGAANDTWWMKALFVGGTALSLGIATGVDIAVNFHNQIHRRVFSNPQIDDWFARLWTITSGWPSYVFSVAHHVHHDYLGTPRDWTIDRSEPGNRPPHILLYSITCWPFRPVMGMVKEWRLRGTEFRRKLLLETIFFAAIWSLPFWMNWEAAMAVWVAPQVIGNLVIVGAGMHIQHATPAAKGDKANSDSLTALSKWFNLAMFNIGFHATHHKHPRAHWAALPRLFEYEASNLVSSGNRVLKSGNFKQASILSEFASQNEHQWQRIDKERVDSDRNLPPSFAHWYSSLPMFSRATGRSLIALWAFVTVGLAFASPIGCAAAGFVGYQWAKRNM